MEVEPRKSSVLASLRAVWLYIAVCVCVCLSQFGVSAEGTVRLLGIERQTHMF